MTEKVLILLALLVITVEGGCEMEERKARKSTIGLG
jgi:hypothetical protein